MDFYQTLIWERGPDDAYTQLCQGQLSSIIITHTCLVYQMKPTLRISLTIRSCLYRLFALGKEV